MNPVKTIFPTLIITCCATLVYLYFSQLATSVQQALLVLPYVLSVAVLLMAVYFNLSGLFYFCLACFTSWFFMDQALLTDTTQVNVVYMGVVMAMLIIGMLTEKGLLTFAAWMSHLSALMIAAVCYGLLMRQPANLTAWLNPPTLPMSWFEWTPLGPTAWLLTLASFIILMLVYLGLKKSQAYQALVSITVVAVLYHHPNNLLLLNLCCVAGLLIMLFGALQKSWHLAYIDELTDLPGRRALEERLQRSLGIYALAMVDIDHFKKFNDNYGHDVGDDVLRMIAAKIGQVTGGGKAYRYGGEEFTVVFNNHSADEIKSHLQDLIDAVAETPFVVNRRKNQKPKTVQVTISIGLTDSIDKTNAGETIKIADEALYQAKKKGRNRLQTKL